MSFANPAVGSFSWFARHEFNLSWRDFARMMSAGTPGREKTIVTFLVLAVLTIHLIALVVLKPLVEMGFTDQKTLLSAITGMIILPLSLMVSQGMELVTRVFYSRSDLDLILSSPVPARKLFTIRIGSIAFATSVLSLLLFGSAINVLAFLDSVWWLAAYPVIFACAALATTLSLVSTVVLFDTLGAKLPARAAMGDLPSLTVTIAITFAMLLASIAAYSASFGERVVLAAGISETKSGKTHSSVSFRPKSTAAALRHKEWKLLLRDHWLISQTLMQILYLLPPAFMLWQGFGNAGALSVVALPVLVMASGQLAGGLAWLAISGEDAPQLVQTAPVSNGAIIRAKIEAVLGAIAVLVAPILVMISIMDIQLAGLAAVGIATATVSATMIQLWFRSQAKRSNFRRRQTSSKVATISEAFSSILWAGTTGPCHSGSVDSAEFPACSGTLSVERSLSSAKRGYERNTYLF